MAATYRVWIVDFAPATTAKVALSVWNGSGSGKVIRLYRAWITPSRLSTPTVTGISSNLHLHRVTTQPSGGTPSSPTVIAHDTNSPSLPGQIVVAGNNTTIANTFGERITTAHYFTDETAAGSAGTEEITALTGLSEMFNDGYGDTNVEPIVVREGQGIALFDPGIASAAGTVDCGIEFTVSDS